VTLRRRLTIAITSGWLSGVLLAAPPALAQALRADEDPFQRVGRTAGEAGRNPPAARPRRAEPASPARRRTATQPRQAEPEALEPRSLDPLATNARAMARIAPPRPQRSRQQNFRSLERPPNPAVPVPPADALVGQGLPPVPPPPRARAAVTDPYAPLGLRAGTLLVLPSAEASVGYNSNPERRSGQKRGSAFARAEGGFALRSDWAVHELTADLRGGYNRYFRTPDADRPDGQGRVNLRLDATRDTAFDFELRGRIDTERPGSANLSSSVEGRPLVYQYGGSAGATQRFNRLALSARASIDRSDYADASLGDGQVLSQKGRNLTQYGLRLRMAYEVTPGLIPFVEGLADMRRYDLAADSTGFQRDSSGLQLRGGTSIELTRTLTGEVAAGYGLRRYEDQRLRDLKGPVVEATLAWAVSPLTNVRLRGTTEFEETTLAGSSGAITRRLSAELSHAFLRNLVVTAAASFARSDFQGVQRRDDTLRASLGAEYGLNRNLVLRASYAHERTTSTTPGNDLSANVWLFGVRTQF
jgi:hypothetical protein